jgi:hypothetical protein
MMFGRERRRQRAKRELDKAEAEQAAYRTVHDLIVRAVGTLDLDAQMQVWDALAAGYDRWKTGLTYDQVYPVFCLVRVLAPPDDAIRSYREPSPFLMQISTSGIE